MKNKKLTAAVIAFLLCAAAFIPVFAEEKADEKTPIAVETTYKTYEGVALNGVMRASNAGNYTFKVEKEPKKGKLTAENEAFVYTPFDNKTGKDYFTFTVTDENGKTSRPARVEIEIIKRKDGDVFRYTDMENDPAHFAAIYLKNNGIICGETFGNESFFYPQKEVTRAQFIAMTACLAELSVPAAGISTGLSDDNDIPVWAKTSVAAALDSGVIYGEKLYNGNRVFRANDPITRAEAAAVLDRALKLSNDSRVIDFKDAEGIPSWAHKAIINTVACGIIETDNENAVNANKMLTRADAAKMLCAALEIKTKKATKGVFSKLWK